MIERGRVVAAMAAIAMLGVGATACGDDSDSPATPPRADNGAQANESPGDKRRAEEGSATPPSQGVPGGEGDSPAARRDSGGGAEQFETPGGDNSVQEFGSEADESELEEAAAALHAFLDARAEGDWATTCDYLSADTVDSIERFGGSQGAGGGCPERLAAVSGPATQRARRDAAIADVGALRVEGDRGFLLYHGAEDVPYAIPMVREDGRWKVASLAGVPLS